MTTLGATHLVGRTTRLLTYWLIIFLIVAALAHKAELVLGVLLWSGAGGSVHQCAGPRVGSGQTLRVSSKSHWSSRGAPRSLSGLKQNQIVPVNTEL